MISFDRMLLEEIREEFDRFMLGATLAEGMYRKVFQAPWSNDEVLKIETKSTSGVQHFCNVREWTFWNDMDSRPEVRRWLAPCLRISEGGRIMVQQRTQPLVPGRRYQVPDWIEDAHPANFGLIKGVLVCHDYALINLARLTGPCQDWGTRQIKVE